MWTIASSILLLILFGSVLFPCIFDLSNYDFCFLLDATIESVLMLYLLSQSLSLKQVIKALLGTSKRNSWSEVVHSKLICIMTNMFYRYPEADGSTNATTSASKFLIDQVDLIGGVEFIFFEVLRKCNLLKTELSF